jgi:endonuclease/exonuclease/phosphatase family metal-dependent hydrolase
MQHQYSFATWNIDGDVREEKHEETRFDVRWKHILAQIAEAKPDILCLQELRNLETSVMTVPRMLYEISQSGYDYKHAYYGPDHIAFAQAIFFRRDKFFPVKMHLHLLPLADKTQPNRSKIVMGVQLRCIESEKSVTIYNTHFGMNEQEKTLSCDWLRGYLDCVNEPYLCAGDYNFFDDLNGIQQRQSMIIDGSREDLAYPLANASGTFMGYEWNEFKPPFEKMSRLDHVFASSHWVKRIGEARVWGDMEQVKQRTYPSDHLMIYFEFTLK